MALELLWGVCTGFPSVLRFLKAPLGYFMWVGLFSQFQVAIHVSQVSVWPALATQRPCLVTETANPA